MGTDRGCEQNCRDWRVAGGIYKGVQGWKGAEDRVGGRMWYWIGKWWQRRKDLLYEELIDWILVPFPLPSEQLDTAHALLVVIIFPLLIYSANFVNGQL